MDHKIKLLGVCRVCGLRFRCKKGRNPKPVSAFQRPISYLYGGYDVGCDKEDVHPPHTCDKCRNALWKVQAAISEGKEPNTMLPAHLPDFSPHEEDCSICSYRETGRPAKKNIRSKRQKEEEVTLSTATTTEDALPTQDVVSTEDVLPTQDMLRTQDVVSTEDVFSTQDVLPTQDVSSTATLPVSSTEQLSEHTLLDEEIVNEAGKHGYIHAATKDTGTLVLTMFQNYNVHLAISQQVNINTDRTWELLAFGKSLSPSSPVTADLPAVLTKSTCTSFFSFLSHCFICNGNVGFERLLNARREGTDCVVFRRKNESVAAMEETGRHIVEGGVTFTRTIRHVDCQMLIPPDRRSTKCECCVQYSHQLRSALSRIKDKPDHILHNSKAPHKHLTVEQLKSKLEDTQKERVYHKTVSTRMKSKVSKVIDNEGCTLNDSQHAFLLSVLEDKKTETHFEKDSAQEFLFRQQLERARQHNAKSMKWHPMMVRWCLALYHSSPAAYKFIRDSGFLFLPHTTTLNQYTKFTEPSPGINPDILTKLTEDAKLDKVEDYKKNVSLVWDEMKIKSKLVYSKGSGELVGFTDLGTINEELKGFEKRCRVQQDNSNVEEGPDLATHVLACMVRGIFSNLEFVFAYYPCCTFTSDQLYEVVWDATRTLQSVGFHVRAFVCDGASPNRRFYRLHGNGEGIVYWTWNPEAEDDDQKIYFFCDVPHLIKTARNNFENSGAHNRTRHLHYNGQDISWTHIQDLYRWDLGEGQAVGLRMLPRITADHVYPTPSLRMRVNLAAQVLSKSVASALRMQGRHYTASTIKFVEMVDKFFDCLNVRHCRQGTRARKPDLEPYRDVNDVRFAWLEEEFLAFLAEWETAAQRTPNMTKENKNRLCLSRQTLEGFRITVASFTTLTKTLLQEEGVNYVLSDKFNQDPLEQHFSKQRRRCGANENPTVMEYGQNEINIHVAGEMMAAFRSRGNCRGRGDDVQIDFSDDTPLRKRPRK